MPLRRFCAMRCCCFRLFFFFFFIILLPPCRYATPTLLLLFSAIRHAFRSRMLLPVAVIAFSFALDIAASLLSALFVIACQMTHQNMSPMLSARLRLFRAIFRHAATLSSFTPLLIYTDITPRVALSC